MLSILIVEYVLITWRNWPNEHGTAGSYGAIGLLTHKSNGRDKD